MVGGWVGRCVVLRWCGVGWLGWVVGGWVECWVVGLGVNFHPLGGAALPLSSVGWCCLPSPPLGGVAFSTPPSFGGSSSPSPPAVAPPSLGWSDGSSGWVSGRVLGWVVGCCELGWVCGWVGVGSGVGWDVGWLGGWVLGGWVVGRLGGWVAGRLGGACRGVKSFRRCESFFWGLFVFSFLFSVFGFKCTFF